MKQRITRTRTSMQGVDLYECETLTEKLRRMTENKEPIKAEVDRIYTEKKDGVLPAYDIRTDRFEVAREAVEKMMNAAEASKQLKTKDVGTEKIVADMAAAESKKE